MSKNLNFNIWCSQKDHNQPSVSMRNISVIIKADKKFAQNSSAPFKISKNSKELLRTSYYAMFDKEVLPSYFPDLNLRDFFFAVFDISVPTDKGKPPKVTQSQPASHRPHSRRPPATRFGPNLIRCEGNFFEWTLAPEPKNVITYCETKTLEDLFFYRILLKTCIGVTACLAVPIA